MGLIPKTIGIIESAHFAKQYRLHFAQLLGTVRVVGKIVLVRVRCVAYKRDDGWRSVLDKKFVWIIGEIEKLRFVDLAVEDVIFDELPITQFHAAHAGFGAAAVDAIKYVADGLPLADEDTLKAHTLVCGGGRNLGEIAKRREDIVQVDVTDGARS